MKKKYLVMLVLLSALFLGGCIKMDTTIVFKANENWDAIASIAFDQETFDEMAQEYGEETLNTEETEAELDAAVREIEEEYSDQGVEASWTTYDPDDEGWIGYRITISGQGYDLLNEIMFDDSATIEEDDSGNVVFSTYSFNSIVDDSEMGEMDDLSGISMFGGEIVFAIEGAKIIETNGAIDSDDDGRVAWVNTMPPYTATIKPGGGALNIPSWAYYVAGGVCCLGILLVIVIAVAVFFIARSRKKKAEAAGETASEAEAPAETEKKENPEPADEPPAE